MIRVKGEDPNRPPSRSDPRRARLRVAAEWLKGNTVAVYALNALADDDAATPYELALMTTAACRMSNGSGNSNESIAAAVDGVAREIARPAKR